MEPLTAHQFFSELFPDLNGSYLEIRKLPGASQTWCRTVDEAVRATMDAGKNVYFGACLRSDKKGDEAHAAVLSALWADVDVKDFGGDREKASRGIANFEHRPTIVVDTGNGWHLYWLMKEPEVITDENRRRFRGILWGIAKALGGDEACRDLSRILRAPWTRNVKDPAHPKPVTVIRWNPQYRYNPSDFDQWAVDTPDDPPPAAAELVEGKIPKGKRDWTLTSLGGTMRRRGMSESAIFAALQTENAERCDPPLPGADIKRISHSVARYKPSAPPKPPPEPSTDPPPSDAPNPPQERRTYYTLSDDGNADRLRDRHGANLRYCFETGWVVWDGRRWAEDKTGEIRRKAVDTVKGIAFEAASEEDPEKAADLFKHAGKCLSDGKIKAMINSAESKLPLPVLITDFDTDSFLLNVNNGTVDLRTGELRPHNREDLLMKLAPVDYDLDAECPEWLKFLDRIMGGNADLIEFLQLSLGYSLTGSTAEECAFMPYGIGANGKSTLLETIEALLGDYAAQIPTEALMLQKNNSATNDIAILRGARFVTAIETDEGRRLAEAKVKQLTGGDKVQARFLFKEFFTFQPEFKLWLACNHKPVIRGNDYAIWRRIRLIPFTIQIPEAERDPDLKGPGGKLRAELPGILRWAIEGCLRWHAEGLKAPGEVRQATEAYKSESDTIGGFIDECCLVEDTALVSSQDLYRAYTSWCDENGENSLTQRTLGAKLTERGLERFKGIGATRRWGWRGIGLFAPLLDEKR